jgi:hypothetical protein
LEISAIYNNLVMPGLVPGLWHGLSQAIGRAFGGVDCS